jgi:hypothetical protein
MERCVGKVSTGLVDVFLYPVSPLKKGARPADNAPFVLNLPGVEFPPQSPILTCRVTSNFGNTETAIANSADAFGTHVMHRIYRVSSLRRNHDSISRGR